MAIRDFWRAKISKTYPPSLTGMRGYLLAAGCVGLALVCRLGVDREWGERMPYTTFFVAAILCIGLTGVGPSLLAIGSGWVLANWFFVPPRHSLNPWTPERLLMGGAYVMNLAIVLGFATWAKRALNQERAQSEALRQRLTGLEASETRLISERKEAEKALRAVSDELAQANERLERSVAERTRALEEKTAELTAFCHTLAHDFRSPLRTQAGFSRILVEEYGDRLGVEGKNLAWRILQAAQRQSDIVEDLLAHISVTKTELPLERVKLKGAIEQARSDLALELQDRQAELDEDGIDEDEAVLANRSSLHVILLNLLTNSFKFIRPDTVPNVRLRTERRGDYLRLWVEDNGIGIRAQDMGRLFSMFQRLNANAYPGTGMGLAIVKKAAERMGGHVGVESELGKGSRFWVEIKGA